MEKRWWWPRFHGRWVCWNARADQRSMSSAQRSNRRWRRSTVGATTSKKGCIARKRLRGRQAGASSITTWSTPSSATSRMVRCPSTRWPAIRTGRTASTRTSSSPMSFTPTRAASSTTCSRKRQTPTPTSSSSAFRPRATTRRVSAPSGWITARASSPGRSGTTGISSSSRGRIRARMARWTTPAPSSMKRPTPTTA